ncbi:autotransporter outer membrane beta-barrel domain-containing protein [Pelagicoccus sp. SDUM812002]|uniref:autotransporter outer membrane beta-barrel domain-containing protein n=1 Tax=Pelagicoccus sp. SDUM812002 TaxID=3041266 RepID=UPI0028101FB8|nr:autotransporter outer membrane beta-barrel domain-containing protein [Pelagicoccus sp. SDUM812002]MDQ8186509.1 autotransporter outer membrane beta-barrel domain-containing protein [Pelagicoccus sp. SDUM812002]
MTHLVNIRNGLLLGAILLGTGLKAQVGNFDSMNSYVAPLEARLADIRSLPANAIGSDVKQPDFSIGYFSNDLDIDQDVGRFQWDSQWDSLQLSYGYRKADWRFGILASFQDGDIESREINDEVPDPAFGNLTHDGWIGGLYVGYDWHPFSLTFVAGEGSSENKMDRSSDLGPTYGLSTAVFDTDSQFLIGTLKMEHFLWEDQLIYPFLSFGFAEIDADGFEESGGPDRRIVSDFSDSQNFLELGISFESGQNWYSPEFAFSYWVDLSNDDVLIDVDAANGTNLGTLVVPNAVESLLKGSIALDRNISDHWNIRVGLDYATGDSTDIFGFGVQAQWTY